MTHRKPFLLILIMLFSFSSFYEAIAQQKVDLPALKQNQKGVYARLAAGIATGKTNYKDNYDITGIPVPFIFQLGYQTGSNVSVYFNYNIMFVVNPVSAGLSVSDLMTIPQVGGGLSFYFGKGKNYIFADGNLANTRLLTNGDVYSTDNGFALNIGWGYDHNIVRHMSIGGSIFYHYSNMKDKDTEQSPVKNNYLGACLSLRFGK